MTSIRELERIGCSTLVILALICGGKIWYELNKGWTVGKVEAALQDAPPHSSTRDQVEEWLKKMKWTSFVFFADVTGTREGHRTMPQLAGLDEKALSGMISGVVPDSNVDLIWPGIIHVYFFFDHNDKLIKHFVYAQVFMS
jgi:hypothetical protein